MLHLISHWNRFSHSDCSTGQFLCHYQRVLPKANVNLSLQPSTRLLWPSRYDFFCCQWKAIGLLCPSRAGPQELSGLALAGAAQCWFCGFTWQGSTGHGASTLLALAGVALAVTVKLFT